MKLGCMQMRKKSRVERATLYTTLKVWTKDITPLRLGATLNVRLIVVGSICY